MITYVEDVVLEAGPGCMTIACKSGADTISLHLPARVAILLAAKLHTDADQMFDQPGADVVTFRAVEARRRRDRKRGAK